MDNYLISPKYGLIVRALAQSSSLRQAAELLEMDPAALNRLVQKISKEHNLIHKSGQRWVLTEHGKKLVSWTSESIARQKILMDEKTRVRISAFAWLAEQKLIPQFKILKNLGKGSYEWSFKTNSTELEKEILNNQTDFVITRFAPMDPTIGYKRIVTQPWVIIVPKSWKEKFSTSPQKIRSELQRLPYIRLSSRHPEELLSSMPQTFADLMIDGFVGVRAAVLQGEGWSCLPKAAVSSLEIRKKVHIIEMPSLKQDEVCVWWLRSRTDMNPLIKIMTTWLNIAFKDV